jgi:hypothetical protein
VTGDDAPAHRVFTHLPEMHHARNGPPRHTRSSLVTPHGAAPISSLLGATFGT